MNCIAFFSCFTPTFVTEIQSCHSRHSPPFWRLIVFVIMYWHHSRAVSRLLRLTCELWKDLLQAGTRKQTTSPTALACYQATGCQTRYPTSYEAQQHGLRDVSTRRETLISRLVYPYGYYVFDTLLYCACKQQAWPVHKTKTVLLSAYAQSRLPALS